MKGDFLTRVDMILQVFCQIASNCIVAVTLVDFRLFGYDIGIFSSYFFTFELAN